MGKPFRILTIDAAEFGIIRTHRRTPSNKSLHTFDMIAGTSTVLSSLRSGYGWPARHRGDVQGAWALEYSVRNVFGPKN